MLIEQQNAAGGLLGCQIEAVVVDPASNWPLFAEKARELILEGKFPREIKEQFMEMLEYFGQSPIIVRSSSLLEDAYGNSFSGKYGQTKQGSLRQ